MNDSRNARPNTGIMTISTLPNYDESQTNAGENAGVNPVTTLAIDENRLFYYAYGAFKHNWTRYDVDLDSFVVCVYWNDDHLYLEGEDAIRFLRITRSRHVRAAEEHHRKSRLSQESRKPYFSNSRRAD